MRAKKLLRLLPYVAIGTIADCQSIIDPTNRSITKVGISIIKSKNHGLKGLNELMNAAGINNKIENGYQFNSQDIAFTLSPILNSSGRISHARLSIMTLIGSGTFAFEAENNTLEEMATKLTQTNESRKEMVKEVVSQISIDDKSNNIFVSGKWNKGIIGLIASRLVNKYNKPTAIIGIPKTILTDTDIDYLDKYIDKLMVND